MSNDEQVTGYIQIRRRMGLPDSCEHGFVLDHIDYLNTNCKGYARLQDIADGYRGVLLKIKDAIEHDNWPESVADDWYTRMGWIRLSIEEVLNDN